MKCFWILQSLFLTVLAQLAPAIQTPAGLISLAGDQSVILHWNKNPDANLAGYKVYRSTTGANGTFYRLNSSLLTAPGYCDLSGQVVNGLTNYYEITAVDTGSQESPATLPIGARPHAFANDDEFLDYVQEASFDYFWYLANPANGLIPDRTATGSPCSIAGEGFGLTAIGIGVDHGWINRSQAAARVLTTLTTFYQGPQGPGTSGVMGYKGWFYHMLDMNTALRSGSSELSSIDSCLFLGGVLYVKQYFNGTNTTETSIRSTADAIFNRVDWNFMSQGTSGVAMGWMPNTGFSGYGNWVGYNEGMIIYCLGLGTATNPLPANAWNGWTSGYNWNTLFGQTYVPFGPLFGYEFSHMWIDFRHLADGYMNDQSSTYFQNSRSAALAEIAYSSTAPYPGYNGTIWGLTACDGPPPTGYTARGLPAAGGFDDGTIAPTAAGGSMCFTPEYSLPTLKAFYNLYRTNLWTENGFRDAFNPGLGWFDTDEIGLDQGPIVVMIENYRTQRVWQLFMQNSEVQRGLQRAGFVTLPYVALDIQSVAAQSSVNLSWNAAAARNYQVEYSPDLSTWATSPGFVQAITNGTFNWLDSGPPATVSAPATASQRFYRVFQVGQAQLSNTGFETVGSGGIYTAAGWTLFGACNRETWAAHTGTYGMAHEWWNGTSSAFYQNFVATPGAKYALSAWFQDDAAAVVTGVYRMKLEYYDSSSSLLGSDIKNISMQVNHNWQQVSLTGNVIPANTATVRVVFDASNLISGETLKIDDVNLIAVP